MKQTVNNVSLIKDQIRKQMEDYAAYRKRNVDTGLESQEYAAVLVQNFCEGLVQAVRTIFYNMEHFYLEFSDLCTQIDPHYKANIERRNSSFVDLELKERFFKGL